MSTTSKTPTASGISRLLAAAGFERSETRSTAIKGWHEWSAGYKVSKDYDGCVQVEHRTSSLRSRAPGRAEEEAARIAEYAETITKAGYGVSVKAGNSPRLIVTAKEG